MTTVVPHSLVPDSWPVATDAPISLSCGPQTAGFELYLPTRHHLLHAHHRGARRAGAAGAPAAPVPSAPGPTDHGGRRAGDLSGREPLPRRRDGSPPTHI